MSSPAPAPAAAVLVEAPPAPRFSLDILSEIKKAQLANGLRQDDFRRYRKYCTRHLRRVRQSVHFLFGKNKFLKKQVTPEIITNARYLLIPLYAAERCWAYAMQLKEDFQKKKDKQIQYHVLRRLSKAARHAELLAAICAARCDDATALEAEAYSKWMTGVLCFDRKDWQLALDALSAASRVYDRLKDTTHKSELYSARVEELEPMVRLCLYELGDKSSSNLADWLRGRKLDGDLADKMERVMEETRRKQAEQMGDLTWRGRTVPVDTEKIRVALVRVRDLEFELKAATDHNDLMTKYTDLFNQFDAASSAVANTLNEKGEQQKSQKTEALKERLDFVSSYLSYHKLVHTIERGRRMFENIRENLDAKTGDKERDEKLKSIVVLTDKLLQLLGELREVVGTFNDLQAVNECEASRLFYVAVRCFYLAESHCHKGQWVNAYVLFNACVDKYIRDARGQLSACARPDPALQERLVEFEQLAQGRKSFVQAKSFLEANAAPAKALPASDVAVPAIKRLEDPEVSFLAQLDSAKQIKIPFLASIPPEFEPVPCKPLLFDLAGHVLPSLFPNLEAKKKKPSASGGFLSSIGSLFGRRG